MKRNRDALLTVSLALLTVACAGPRAGTAPAVPATDEANLTMADASPGLRVSEPIARACALPGSPAEAPRFGYDTDELVAADRDALARIADCLTTGALKDRPVRLVGRADPRGTEAYNMVLGAKRANTVARYLRALGVDGARLQETSRGELDARGEDEASWTEDRRVDIVLVDDS